MMLLLARVPALRLVRTPRGWLPVAAWAFVAVVSALLARSGGSVSGASHVLRGSFAYLVLPLTAFAMVGAVHGLTGLRRGIRGVVALGADPRRAALASVVVAVVASAVACGVLAALVGVIAHGIHDPPLVADVVTSFGVAALGGGAYGAFFSAGSALGKGTMRGAFLAFDWFLGASSGTSALFTPRGHVHALLGGPLCADISQRASSLALLAIALVSVALALLFTRRV